VMGARIPKKDRYEEQCINTPISQDFYQVFEI
jgi:hypothetical protein